MLSALERHIVLNMAIYKCIIIIIIIITIISYIIAMYQSVILVTQSQLNLDIFHFFELLQLISVNQR